MELESGKVVKISKYVPWLKHTYMLPVCFTNLRGDVLSVNL